jgi:dipeptidyl-peptidase-4
MSRNFAGGSMINSNALVRVWLTLFLTFCCCITSALAQQSSLIPGQLTVDRIFAEPSLSGYLTQGIAWCPDNKKLSYLATTGSGKDRHTSLWLLNFSSRERFVLIPAEVFENTLSAPLEDGIQPGSKPARHAPSDYAWAPDSTALLLSDSNSLAWFDIKTQTARLLVTGKDELSDAKISPDGKFVSFIRDHNLWLVGTSDGKPRPLTTQGSEELRKGELDWVYPEELDITTAYWWAPDSSSVAFLEMDERPVSQFPLVNFESFTGETKQERYPVAGGKNPIVHVYVAPVPGGAPRLMDTGANTDIYLPRVDWLPDSKRLAIQRLDRTQTTLDLLLADAKTGKSAAILTDKDPYWINVSDDLHFFKDGKQFLWSSERSGYRHLYLYDLNGKELEQLTHGEWEVRRLLAVDEAKGVVYFTATEKSPIERHLYRVGLDGSGFLRLSKQDGVHVAKFSPNNAFYIDSYSNADTPPRQDIYHADGSRFSVLNENKVPELAAFRLSPVEFFTIQSHDNATFHCFMIKPPNFDPSKKYPVLTFVYGGPGVQVVMNAWSGPELLWHQLMAQKGYIVFAMDNRGSSGRGHLFEEPIHYRFAAQEMSDQRDGAVWLKHQPYVDPNRIGIWGWSYGGHMTLHAMFEAPEVFKAGFAIAPVTDWHLYDTIYTERYLGIPDSVHDESYDESSPIKNAKGLSGQLLIAHGSGDDNVHYSNTLALLNELIRLGKYAEVMTFPGRSHCIEDPPARRLLFNRATQFFLDHL